MIGCGIMSSVWSMILQRDSTIKVSIKLPVATTHRCNTTEQDAQEGSDCSPEFKLAQKQR